MSSKGEAEQTRPQVAAEVLELGQMLFDVVIDAASQPAPAAGEPFPTEEVRETAEEFFHALRILLGLEGRQARIQEQ